MIGRTLGAYFFRRYLVITGQFFLGVLIIAYIADFTEFTRRAGSLPSYTLGGGLLISALRLPTIVEGLISFVVLFAAMATLMSLNRKYELVIARSAGVSAWQFLLPLCLGSFLIGVVMITAFNSLSAWAFSKAEMIETQFRGAPRDSGDDRLPWLRQRTSEGVTIIGARNSAQRGLLLSDVTFLRIADEGGVRERLDAREATLGDREWVLADVVRTRADGQRESLATATVATDLEPAFVAEQFARPESVPLFQLGGMIDAARSFGLNANAFATQYHSLLALPFQLVAMTLIAATVSMRFARLGQSAVMILGGVLAGFLLYVASVLVKAFGSSGFVPPMMAAWVPVIVAGLYGVTFLLYKEDG